jgi:sugar-specific transcriptional regulator TrmB
MRSPKLAVYNLRELFDLTKYEATVYLSLIKLKKATVVELMADSNVPRGKIYDALNSLKYKKLISTVVFSRPRIYSIISPKINAQIFVDQIKGKLNKQVEWFNDLVTESNSHDMRREVSAEVIRGRENEHEYFDLIRARAKKYIHHATSIEGLKRAYQYTLEREGLDEPRRNKSNIIMKVLAPYNKESLDIARKLIEFGRVEVRLVNKPYFFAAYIADDYYLLSAVGLCDNMAEYEKHAMVLYMESKALAKVLNASFMKLWNNAMILTK